MTTARQSARNRYYRYRAMVLRALLWRKWCVYTILNEKKKTPHEKET